jgi:hypothetical protein
MKRFFKKIALFLFILLVILFLMNRWMDDELFPHYPLQYEEAFHPKVNADVVVLGASQATHGINPKYLESEDLKVFNFALNGAPPSFYIKWYQRVFRPFYRKPLAIVYSVHWVMFDDQFLGRQFENDSKYFPFLFFIQQFREVKEIKTLLFNRFAFSRERKELLPFLLGKRKEIYQKSKYYNGFIPFKFRKNLQKTKVEHPNINPVQQRAFEELLDHFERDGIKVILVQTPGYLYGREEKNIEQNVKLLREIAQKRRLPFLDYETERISAINTHEDYFADWTHMNEKGSEAFSKLLRKDLGDLLNASLKKKG